jgi:hypothetical protein
MSPAVGSCGLTAGGRLQPTSCYVGFQNVAGNPTKHGRPANAQEAAVGNPNEISSERRFISFKSSSTEAAVNEKSQRIMPQMHQVVQLALPRDVAGKEYRCNKSLGSLTRAYTKITPTEMEAKANTNITGAKTHSGSLTFLPRLACRRHALRVGRRTSELLSQLV